jgi:dTMP kinase
VSLFVTLEGPEGSGKTTQWVSLRRALEERGIPAVFTREPGGTAIGEQIRSLLHDACHTDMTPEAEILLFSAARAQHVSTVIRPALARGEWVISDRYAESTLAYQGYGRGLDLEQLRQITAFATGGLEPHLVIYLDLDVRVGLERKRREALHGQGEWTRLDQESLTFHHRVRDGYLELARARPEHWLIVDAMLPAAAIHARIVECVLAQGTSHARQ